MTERPLMSALFKITSPDGEEGYVWPEPTPLPCGGELPGEWVTLTGSIIPTRNALHLFPSVKLPHLCAGSLYLAEPAPDATVITLPSGVVCCDRARLVRRMAWTPEKARTFARHCARRVWHLLTSEERAQAEVALAMAVAYDDGLASRQALVSAQAPLSAASSAASSVVAWAACPHKPYVGAEMAAREAAFVIGLSGGDAALEARGLLKNYNGCVASERVEWWQAHRAVWKEGFSQAQSTERLWQARHLLWLLEEGDSNE